MKRSKRITKGHWTIYREVSKKPYLSIWKIAIKSYAPITIKEISNSIIEENKQVLAVKAMPIKITGGGDD